MKCAKRSIFVIIFTRSESLLKEKEEGVREGKWESEGGELKPTVVALPPMRASKEGRKKIESAGEAAKRRTPVKAASKTEREKTTLAHPLPKNKGEESKILNRSSLVQ